MAESGTAPEPNDRDPHLLGEGGTAGALIEAKPAILETFVRRVRHAFPAAAEPSPPVIVDTLPMFITELAVGLSRDEGPESAIRCSTIAVEHGSERARLTGYSLDNLLQEYQVLREVIFDALLKRGALKPREVHLINNTIDAAMRDATAAFVSSFDELRNQIAATLTHDLRGPLSAAHNYVELLNRAGGTPDARSRFSAGAMRNITRVRQMIDDLLDHSRYRAGERIPLQLAECELVILVREVLADLTASSGDRFTLHAPPEVRGVWCESALKRAIFNLVENASKYAYPDVPVTVTIVQERGTVLLSVHNFGPAISREDQLTLFDAFKRGGDAERSTTHGWGLGLAAVRLIAEGHGGSVVVSSSARDGTTFLLSLPLDSRDALRPGPGLSR